jgi:hypothetical protein
MKQTITKKRVIEEKIVPKVLVSQLVELLEVGNNTKTAFAIVLKDDLLRITFSENRIYSALTKYYNLDKPAHMFHFGGKERASTKKREAQDLANVLYVTVNHSEKTGIPIINLLQSISTSLQMHSNCIDNRRVAIAGPKQTVLLLKVLPIIGVFLGFALGVNPFSIILDGSVGTLCTLVGTGFYVIGNKWVYGLIEKASYEKIG